MDSPIDVLCPGCFADKGRANPCPHCGYDEQAERGPLILPHRTRLHEEFMVGRVLGKPGGFGITYLGWDLNLQTRVAIKEFLPRDLAGRSSDRATVAVHSQDDGELFRFGLEQFLLEARTLAQLDHPNIVRVRHFFEANGTAYLVMDYYQGLSLAEYLDQRGGRLPEDQAKQLILPILDGLRAVHAKGFLHRDLKPQNLYLARLDSGGVRPILLDFGAARHAMGERSRSLSAIITPGYAPFEQYHRNGVQGPWTDIYSASAVLYRMVTGVTPPEATERRDRDTLRFAAAFGVSPALSQALGEAMAQIPEGRPQTVQGFQALLAEPISAPPQPISASPPAPAPFSPTSPVASRARMIWLLLAVVLAVVLVGGGALAWRESARQEQQAQQQREQELQRQRDDRAFAAARAQDAVPAYRMYLGTCTADGCGHQAEALARLDDLDRQEGTRQRVQRDDAAYAQARREDTGDSYLAYLGACADNGCGHHVEVEQALARKLKSATEQEKIQQAARDGALYAAAQRANTETAFRQYLNNCQATGCGHRSEASAKLAELEQKASANHQAALDEILYAAAQRANTEAAFRLYLNNCQATGCGHRSEASAKLAELEQQRRAAEARQAEERQAEERRRQAPVARVRAYFDYLAAHQVNEALACLLSPTKGGRKIVENIRTAQIHELRLDGIEESTATVWIDWTGTTLDGTQQRWRGPIQSPCNGTAPIGKSRPSSFL
ncbi:MAG: serine/threonine-protein kinase [Chromatiaceae bacterium]